MGSKRDGFQGGQIELYHAFISDEKAKNTLMEKNLADNDKTSKEDSINSLGQFRNFKKENKKSKLKRGKNSSGLIKEVIDELDETRTSIIVKRYEAGADSKLNLKSDSELDLKLDSKLVSKPDSKLYSEIEKIHRETDKEETKYGVGDNIPTIGEVLDETTNDHNDEKIVLLRRKTNTIKNRDHIVSKSIIIVSNSIIKSTKSQDEVILRNSKKPRLKRVPTEIESSSGTGSEEDDDQDISNQTFTDSIDKVVDDDVAVKTDLKKYQDEITLQKLEVYAC